MATAPLLLLLVSGRKENTLNDEEKVIGKPCRHCDRTDIPVISFGFEWGLEYCAKALRGFAEILEDPDEETWDASDVEDKDD